jgi:hypothetical protein
MKQIPNYIISAALLLLLSCGHAIETDIETSIGKTKQYFFTVNPLYNLDTFHSSSFANLNLYSPGGNRLQLTTNMQQIVAGANYHISLHQMDTSFHDSISRTAIIDFPTAQAVSDEVSQYIPSLDMNIDSFGIDPALFYVVRLQGDTSLSSEHCLFRHKIY